MLNLLLNLLYFIIIQSNISLRNLMILDFKTYILKAVLSIEVLCHPEYLLFTFKLGLIELLPSLVAIREIWTRSYTLSLKETPFRWM